MLSVTTVSYENVIPRLISLRFIWASFETVNPEITVSYALTSRVYVRPIDYIWTQVSGCWQNSWTQYLTTVHVCLCQSLSYKRWNGCLNRIYW